MVLQQKPLEKADFIVKITGPVMVRLASSGKWKVPLDNPYIPVQPQRAQGMSEIIFNTQREFSHLQGAMKCFTYCINTNETPNHLCERCNLVCNHHSSDLFTSEDIMFLCKSSPSWYFSCIYMIKIFI